MAAGAGRIHQQVSAAIWIGRRVKCIVIEQYVNARLSTALDRDCLQAGALDYVAAGLTQTFFIKETF